MENIRVADGRTGRSSSKGRGSNVVWIVAAILLVVALVGVAVVLALYFVPGCTMLQYGVVFDAGSSHTDMTIFRWPGAKLDGTGVVVEVTRCDVEGPGISSYASDPAGAGGSIDDCLTEAKKKVPDDRKKVTPVFLGATAGMRILHLDEPEQSAAVMKSVEQKFSESGFIFEEDKSQIISGQAEGEAAWIAANLMQRTLGMDGEKRETLGTLDLGGASTQIAFETTQRKPGADASDHVDMRLYGFDFSVYTHSYLCFGMNEALRRYQVQLILDAKNRGPVDNPCLQGGHNQDILASDLFGKACTVKAPEFMGENLDYTITFIGKANTTKCREGISRLLDAAKCKEGNYKECIDGSYVPDVKGTFVAMSGFYHTAAFFNVTTGTSGEYHKSVDNYCRMPWATVQEMKKTKLEFLIRNCFVGNYVHQMLTEIYGFTNGKWDQVKFVRKIAGVTTGWTLGFMTKATNSIPTEMVKAINTQVFAALLIIFIVIILIIAIVAYRAYARKRSRSSTLN